MRHPFCKDGTSSSNFEPQVPKYLRMYSDGKIFGCCVTKTIQNHAILDHFFEMDKCS